MLLPILILAVSVLIFTLQGYFKGFVRILSQIVSLVAAYILAFVALVSVANLLREHTPLQGMPVYPVAGLLIFVPVSITVSWAFGWLDRYIHRQQSLSRISRIAGAVFGIIPGVAIGLLVIYCVSILEDFATPRDASIPSPLSNLSRNIVSKTGFSLIQMIHPDAASMTAAFLHSPVDTGQRIYRVAQLPALRIALTDPSLLRLLDEGRIDDILAHPSFLDLVSQPDLLLLLQQSGHSDNQTPSAQSLAEAMVHARQELENFRQKPEVQAIINDPDFHQMLEQQQYVQLINDPRLPELLDAFMSAVKESHNKISPD